MGDIKVFSLTPQPLHNEDEDIKSDPLRKACEELIDEFLNLFEQKEQVKKFEKKIKLICFDKGITSEEAKILIKLCKKRAEGIYKGEGDWAQETLFKLEEEAKRAEELFKYLPPFKRLEG